jgi:hypothetical protein
LLNQDHEFTLPERSDFMSAFQFFHLSTDTYTQPQSAVALPSYKKKVVVLIASLFVLRLVLAFVLELGNDEAYYWLYSQYMQWNYFDHPPLVAVWIRIFTVNLSLDHFEGFVRLGSVAGCALASWFLFKAVALIHSPRAGWYVVILYHASFYASVTAGLYILPDSPQMVFWTLDLWMIARISADSHSWKNWLLFGVITGLCIMSKVHGAFLWIGMGGFILFQKNSWFRLPQLYCSVLFAIIIISPIFLWNLQYDFATFRFHSNRIDVTQLAPHINYILKELASQIGFNNPVNYFLVMLALYSWFKRRLHFNTALAIYNFVAIPLAFLLLFISIFTNVTLPHWSGPAYVTLFPLAAIWLAERTRSAFPSVLKWALGLFAFVYLGYAAMVNWYPGTWGSTNEADMGRGDVTLDMYGWRKASGEFEALYRQDVEKGIMKEGSPLVTTHWWGAHVEYYFAHPLGLKMMAIGNPSRLNEYLWINKWRQGKADPASAYCIIPSDDKYYMPSNFYVQKELARVIEIKRNGRPAHQFLVYRLKGLKTEVPTVQ